MLIILFYFIYINMKYKTRQQRNFTFRQIVKRKNKKTRKQENKKTRKQRNFTFRQIVKRKNKKTRKQQRGGLWGMRTMRSIYDSIKERARIHPSDARARAARAAEEAAVLMREAEEGWAGAAMGVPVTAGDAASPVDTGAEEGRVVRAGVMDGSVALGIPVVHSVRAAWLPVNSAISSNTLRAPVGFPEAPEGVPVTSFSGTYGPITNPRSTVEDLMSDDLPVLEGRVLR